jgi:hypothetical protein
MFASQLIPELRLRACPDRRTRDRRVHREPVQIDGRLAIGRDISACGLSVFMRSTMSVGDVVHVWMCRPPGRTVAAARPARVVRVEASFGRFIVGLEFIR